MKIGTIQVGNRRVGSRWVAYYVLLPNYSVKGEPGGTRGEAIALLRAKKSADARRKRAEAD